MHKVFAKHGDFFEYGVDGVDIYVTCQKYREILTYKFCEILNCTDELHRICTAFIYI